MKKLFFITAPLLLFSCFLQKDHFDRVRQPPKLTLETPPGCVWLHDSLLIDQTEVRNLDYIEFLYWLARHDPALCKRMLPDTLVWRDASVRCTRHRCAR